MFPTPLTRLDQGTSTRSQATAPLSRRSQSNDKVRFVGMLEISKVKWSPVSVRTKGWIRHYSKRARGAYEFWMNFEASAYKEFVDIHENILQHGGAQCDYLPHVWFLRQYVECALWPHLYPSKDFCDTVYRGTPDGKDGSRSSKHILAKVASPVLDHSLSFDLLQFHYDRYVISNVSEKGKRL